MTSFNDNLKEFLLECRTNALVELQSSPKFAEWHKKKNALQSKIESQVSAELFDNYLEALSAIQSMEMNTALLFGAMFSIEVGKRFDSSLPESKEFAESFIG